MQQRYGMQRLLSISAVLIALFVYGDVLHAATKPPEGAVTAARGFPSVGTTWITKTVVHGKGIIVTKTHTVLADSTHHGKPVHRLSDGAKILLFDTASRNWTANVRAGQELNAASPYVPTYAFPLWVEKSWQGTFTYYDRERGATFANVVWRGQITAYEEVTVPAGTFKAFKLEVRGPTMRQVVWYAPTLHIRVKSSFERLPGHYLGTGKFTSELIKYTAK